MAVPQICREDEDGEGPETSSQEPNRKRSRRPLTSSTSIRAIGAEYMPSLQKKLRKATPRAEKKSLGRSSGLSNSDQESKEVEAYLRSSQLSSLLQKEVEIQLRNIQSNMEKKLRAIRKEMKNLYRKLEQLNPVQEVPESLDGNTESSNQVPAEVEGLVDDIGTSNPIPKLPVNQNSTARYRLKFQNDIPENLYTCNKVKSKDGEDVEIAIFDTLENIVTSTPLSSAKVEVVVLDGEFCADGQESWSKEEFGEHIVKAREGKGQLLSGKVVISLNQGVGRLKDIEFRYNSSCWTSSKKFRLGLRLHQNEDTRVGEGISGSFRVKDRRVKGNEKHHPPLPTDEVYYLDGIRKDGPIHKRLLAAEITRVQELLQACDTNPGNLRRLLGGNNRGVSEGTWEAITKHARECNPGDERKQVSAENLRTCTFQVPGGNQLFAPPANPSIQNLPQRSFARSTHEISSFTMQHEHISVADSVLNPLRQTLSRSAQEFSSFRRQQELSSVGTALSPLELSSVGIKFFHLAPASIQNSLKQTSQEFSSFSRQWEYPSGRHQVPAENLRTCTFQSPVSNQLFAPLANPSIPDPPRQSFAGLTPEGSSFTRQHEHISDELSSSPIFSNGPEYFNENLDSLQLNYGIAIDQTVQSESVWHSDGWPMTLSDFESFLQGE